VLAERTMPHLQRPSTLLQLACLHAVSKGSCSSSAGEGEHLVLAVVAAERDVAGKDEPAAVGSSGEGGLLVRCRYKQ